MTVLTPVLRLGGILQVWKGRLVGTTEDVAIKKSKIETQVAVFNEAEVAVSHLGGPDTSLTNCVCVGQFLMSMQHERLVKFIGAGSIWDEVRAAEMI